MYKKLFAFGTALLLAIVLLSGGHTTSLAQNNNQQITVTATAGYGDSGSYLLGEWVPVRITVSNPAGGQARRVRVVVNSSSTPGEPGAPPYEREIDLPAQSRKEVTIFTYSGNFAHGFRASVYEGNTELASATADADPYEPPNTFIVGVVSSDKSLLNTLRGETIGHRVRPYDPMGIGSYAGSTPTPWPSGADAVIAHMALSEIPTLARALDSLGALVLEDSDTASLSAEQAAAIESWVQRGGMLVGVFRPANAGTFDGLRSLWPVSMSGSRSLPSLASISELVMEPMSGTGTLTVGDAQVRTGRDYVVRVPALQVGTPLLAIRDFGQGKVVYLGASPGLPPLKGWDGLIPLLKRIFAERDLMISYGASLRFTPTDGFFYNPTYETFTGLFGLPGLDLPDAWLVGTFLLLYIIIVGPINFIVLRRLRRAELAWITIPALVALFSIAAYSLALGSKGASVIGIRATALNSAEGSGITSLEQHVGIFSPNRRTYALRTGSESLVQEMEPYYVGGNEVPPAVLVGGNSTQVRDFNVNTWSLRALLAEHSVGSESPLQLDLRIGDNKISGTVTNSSNARLEDVALIRGEATQYIGALEPGQRGNVALDIRGNSFDVGSPGRILPAPPGVTAPTGGYYYYAYDRPNTPEQRRYDRKVALMRAGLYPYLRGESPATMQVVALAWASSAPVQFEVEGEGVTYEDVTLWLNNAHARAEEMDQARMRVGSVPFVVYAPGNTATLLPLASPLGARGAPARAEFQAAPYADFLFRLPAGIRPDSLFLRYTLHGAAAADQVFDLLAYSARTGTWERVGKISGEEGTATLSISNPSTFTGAAGDVTLRLVPSAGSSMVDGAFELSLNVAP